MAIGRDDRGIWKKALWLVPLLVGVGSAAGILSNSGYSNQWFDGLNEPSFMPPAWLFGAAWTTFYTMLAIAAATVMNERRSKERSSALTLFVIHMLLNFSWSPVFFGMQQITLGKYLLFAILATGAVVAGKFWRIRPLAGALMIPYLGWLIFATVLNSAFESLNPGM